MDTQPLKRLEACPAPAKLNLFLHVTGRRLDGYHQLQTIFRLVDWADSLTFNLRSDGCIVRTSHHPGIPPEQDLVVRAAHLLKSETGCRYGADIHVTKNLPMGGGLGGGSSDAATTLIALNRLWGTHLKRQQLAALSLQLGADVPFFIHGTNAFAEGIGENLFDIALPEAFYVIVVPPVHVPTREIFEARELTRDTEPIKISDFAFRTTWNDLQPVACARHPEIDAAIKWLEQFASARMTGSGACVFAEVANAGQGKDIVDSCPPCWQARVVRGLMRHPLYSWTD